MNTELKSAEEWLATPAYAGLKILDPDGWDRSPEKWEASWNEKITRDEFDARWGVSTIQATRAFMQRVVEGANK